jgi:hypothetical protein
MVAAVPAACERRPLHHRDGGRRGSVAEELLGAFDDPRIARASINNGGDIALR